MGHYVKLYFASMKRSLISRMEYKKDTFVAMLGFFLENALSIAGIYFIVTSVESLNGWNVWQIGFLYGFLMLPRGLDHLLTDELWRVAYFRVKQGDLDRDFLRPVPVLFTVLSETFQPDAFGELIVGTFMLIFCGIQAKVVLSFSSIILMIVATIFGAMIITAWKIALSSLAFRFGRTGQLVQVVYNFMDYVRYPLSILPNVLKYMLLFFFPYALFISLPVEQFLFGTGINPYLLCLAIISMAFVFLGLSILVWNFNEKRYESTGN